MDSTINTIKRWISESVILFLIPIFGYLVAALYEKAVFEKYGIASEVMEIGTNQVVNASLGLLLFGIAVAFVYLILDLFLTKYGNLVKAYIAYATVVVGLAIIMSIQYPAARVFISSMIVIIYLNNIFMIPFSLYMLKTTSKYRHGKVSEFAQSYERPIIFVSALISAVIILSVIANTEYFSKEKYYRLNHENYYLFRKYSETSIFIKYDSLNHVFEPGSLRIVENVSLSDDTLLLTKIFLIR
jgi:hypothetical protein